MTEKERMMCYNAENHCMNPCVAECDLGDGKGVQWYCRECIENIDVDMEDWERDDSLIFCQTEWEKQG